MNIDYGVSKNCINHDSYGEICVRCNMCGRFDKSTMWQCRYEHYASELKDLVSKLGDEFFQTTLQQTNIAKDIQYTGKNLEKTIQHMVFGAWSMEEVEVEE